MSRRNTKPSNTTAARRGRTRILTGGGTFPPRVGGLETEISLRVPPLPNESRVEQIQRNLQLVREFVASCPDNADIAWSYRYPVELYRFDAVNRVLANGSRLYSDHSYVEYSTAECSDPLDLVAVDQSGERLLAQLLGQFRQSLPGGKAVLVKNNVVYPRAAEHYAVSHACHENYTTSPGLFHDICHGGASTVAYAWLSYLASRIIITGAGRLSPALPDEFAPFFSSARLPELMRDPGTGSADRRRLKQIRRNLNRVQFDLALDTQFEISARAAFMTRLRSHETTEFRPLINLRDEPHADPYRYRRLHVISGDSNRSETSTYLKFGCALLVLALLETAHLPAPPVLLDPLNALRRYSRDVTLTYAAPAFGDTAIRAIELQEYFWEQVQLSIERGNMPAPPWSQPVMDLWRTVLDDLRVDPLRLGDRLDWIIKLRLLSQISVEQRVDDLAWRRRFDLAYHSIGPGDGYLRLLKHGQVKSITTDERVSRLTFSAPADTRAAQRMSIIAGNSVDEANWNYIQLADGTEYWLDDPA